MNEEEYLRDIGIKVTKARINILHILKESNKSLTAEDIHRMLYNDKINIDLSTIYRTLENFYKNSIINRWYLDDGRYSYSLKMNGHKHLIKCSICNKEVEYECPMPQIKELIKKEVGFYVTCGDIILEGVCDNCKKKKH